MANGSPAGARGRPRNVNVEGVAVNGEIPTGATAPPPYR